MIRYLPKAGYTVPDGEAGEGGGPAPTPTYTVFLSEPDPAVDGVVELQGFIDPAGSGVVLMCFLVSPGSGPLPDDDFEIAVTVGSSVSGGGALLFFSPDVSGNFTLEITALNGASLPFAYVTAGGASHTTAASRELDFT
jgi:hypothetical protein